MPFCPECGYEYVAGIARCPDCNAKLVEELPPEKIDTKELELVPLYDLPGIVYSEMVKEVLEKEGIECFIKSDPLTSGFGAKGASMSGQNAVIYVKKEDKKKAEKILHDMLDHI